MSREWQIVWDHRLDFLAGLWTTVELTLIAAAGSLILGALLSMALMSKRPAILVPAHLLVDAMRCIPFLLFAYVIYYGLPSLGLRLNSWYAGLTALVLYNTAYMAEAFRGGRRALSLDIVEAGTAFGFRRFSLARYVVFPPIIFQALPIIGNQIIQIVKDSSFLAIITIPELTHTANAIQSNYYIPFASFAVAVLLYWLLTLAIEAITTVFGRMAEVRR